MPNQKDEKCISCENPLVGKDKIFRHDEKEGAKCKFCMRGGAAIECPWCHEGPCGCDQSRIKKADLKEELPPLPKLEEWVQDDIIEVIDLTEETSEPISEPEKPTETIYISSEEDATDGNLVIDEN